MFSELKGFEQVRWFSLPNVLHFKSRNYKQSYKIDLKSTKKQKNIKIRLIKLKLIKSKLCNNEIFI